MQPFLNPIQHRFHLLKVRASFLESVLSINSLTIFARSLQCTRKSCGIRLYASCVTKRILGVCEEVSDILKDVFISLEYFVEQLLIVAVTLYVFEQSMAQSRTPCSYDVDLIR
jgi:hypothetical protein